MKNTLFWVLFFIALGLVEIFIGVKLFHEEHTTSGIIMCSLGVVALVLSGVIGVIG